MTEDEAKTKWCPFARVSANHGDSASNRSVGLDDGLGQEPHLFQASRCVGSACMAWRWEADPEKGKQYGLHSPEMAVAIYGTDEQKAEQRAKIAAMRPGFCGLAGQP